MKSYNQFIYEVYDLQESGQIELSENPLKDMTDKFQSGLRSYSQSPINKNLNKAYSAVSRNPVVRAVTNNPITKFISKGAPVVDGMLNAADRRSTQNQSLTRSTVGAGVETAAGWKAATALGGKAAAACLPFGGPAGSAACGLAGGVAGYNLGRTTAREVLKRSGAGTAMDKHDPIGQGVNTLMGRPPATPTTKKAGKNN